MTRAMKLMGAGMAALVLGTGAASAQALDGGFYLKGFGGATWFGDESASIRENGQRTGERFGVDYDTGYTLGAAAGYNVTPNLALELEYAYRRADGTITVTDDGDRSSGSGTTSSNSVMVNALYTFTGVGGTGQVQPYVGAGIGGAWVDLDGAESDALLAYQLIGGVGYEVAPNWTLFGEGRWYGANTGRYSDDGSSFDTSFETIDLLVGARYAF